MIAYKICVIGLGNVGLDLAINFSKKYQTIGYDIDKKLVEKIRVQKKKHLKNSNTNKNGLTVSCNHKMIVDCDVYIVTVPTPLDQKNQPNLDSVFKVTRLISKFLKKNNIVIYESTFYPGLTEELCIPILEKGSKLKINHDFYVGYSPERINIGEHKKMSNDIIKITSGSNQAASKIIDNLYRSVIEAGTFSVDSIKIAEAAKILENCQRDLNIALMNELTKYFEKININIKKVIDAASTKWNFAKFSPGLVGGDCIAVDPYYLIHSAKRINYDLQLVCLARKTNESMTEYVYKEIVKKISEIKIQKLAFFGVSYKENCSQINNSMYLKVANKLKKIYSVDIYDHLVKDSNFHLSLKNIADFDSLKYDAIVIGSKHKKYKKMIFKSYLNKSAVIIDIHGVSIYSENVIL